MKIALLTTLMEPGGAQKAMLQLGVQLREAGHEVIAITMYDKGDFIEGFERRFSIPIHDLGMKKRGLRKFSAPWGGLWRLYRLLRRERVDVLQTFTHYSNIVGPLVGWLARVRLRISSQRNRLDAQPRWVRRLDPMIANSHLVHGMVAVSEATKLYCVEEQGIKAEKLVTIRNGIDVTEYPVTAKVRASARTSLALADDCVAFICVARLHPQKGHEYLLRAFAKVAKRDARARLVLVGDGASRHILESLAKGLGILDVTRFLGARQDIQDLLRACDVFVLPSLWEGMPNAVLEAMAERLPVIATTTDGTVEVVVDGVTGILVPPADPERLETAMQRLLSAPSSRRNLGLAGRAHVERRFSLEHMAGAFELYYEKKGAAHGRQA